MTEREYIEKQADDLGVTIVGKLRRSTEHETAEVEKCFVDEAGNLYKLRHGVLTIRGTDGAVVIGFGYYADYVDAASAATVRNNYDSFVTTLGWSHKVPRRGVAVCLCAHAVLVLHRHVKRMIALHDRDIAKTVPVEFVRDLDLQIPIIEPHAAIVPVFHVGRVESIQEFFCRERALPAKDVIGDTTPAPFVRFAVFVCIGQRIFSALVLDYHHGVRQIAMQPDLNIPLDAADILGVGDRSHRQYHDGRCTDRNKSLPVDPMRFFIFLKTSRQSSEA